MCVHGTKEHCDERNLKVYNRENKLFLVGHCDPLRNLSMIPIEDNNDGQPRVNSMEQRVTPSVEPSKKPMVEPRRRHKVTGIPRVLSNSRLIKQQP